MELTLKEIPKLPDSHEAKGKYGRVKEGQLVLNGIQGGLKWVKYSYDGTASGDISDGFIATLIEKEIDLSPLIGSGIACEFTASDARNECGFLEGINDKGLFVCERTGLNYSLCRPVAGRWFFHDGGPCPVPVGFNFDVKLGSSIATFNAHNSVGLRWDHTEKLAQGNIMGVRITGKIKGYK